MRLRKIKRKLLLPILLVFAFNELGTPNLAIMKASAADSPYIAVVPGTTVDPALAPGMNYTISINTDYNGNDVWGFEFKLTFNPNVLEGIEVVNGDLITEDVGPIVWAPGTFDNTAGYLSLTGNVFFAFGLPKPVTSGPGTLANITFGVVGRGISNITLETQGPERTKLMGYTEGGHGTLYNIIDPETMPDHIQHGYFKNVLPIHDVAVISLDAPAEVTLGDLITINVTVANEGNFTETFNITVYANATEIETQKVTDLASGYATSPLAFSWNTTDAAEGNYTLTANATVLQSVENPEGVDEDPIDNTGTAEIKLKMIHDVAVSKLALSEPAIIGPPMSINVTVANQGHYNESVTLTVIYLQLLPYKRPIDNATRNFTLNVGGSKTESFKWNTTGLDPKWYQINATATIPLDEDLGDNTKIESIELTLAHDVTVYRIRVKVGALETTSVIVGELVTIEVSIKNLGGYNETFDLDVTYNNITIEKLESVTLDSGDSKWVEFIWNTTGVDPGSYNITAEAILPEYIEDVNPDNNLRTKSIDVNPRGAIAGTVTDALTGDPILGANITVTSSDYTQTKANTDANGHYTITDVSVGNYTVTVSATGYESASQHSITVVAGEPTTVDFTLRVISTISMSVDPATITVGKSTTISGSITPALQGVNVTIQYRLSPAEAWTNLNTVTTNESGQYSFQWTPETADTFEVKALWLGDENTSPAEGDVQTITVQEPPSGTTWNLYTVAIVAAGVIAIIMAAAFYFLRIRKPKTK